MDDENAAEIIINPANEVLAQLTAVLQEIVGGRQQEPVHPPAQEVPIRIKPPTYNGSGDVEFFITQFRDVAHVSHWNHQLTLLQLREALKESAKDCCRGHTVEDIFASLRLRFGLTPREARAKLSALKKENKTPLQEHAVLVERLMQAAYANLPRQEREDLIMDHFCASLSHVGLQRHLLAVATPNLDAAVRAGNEYLEITANNNFKTGLVRQVESEDSIDVNQTNTKETSLTEKLLQDLIKKIDNLGSSGRWVSNYRKSSQYPQNNRAYDKSCWNCGETGHLIRNCPKPTNDQNQVSNEKGLRQ